MDQLVVARSVVPARGGRDGCDRIEAADLVAAFSVISCASLAESISAGTLSATAVYPTLALLLLLDAALFLGPLLVFTDKLWVTRTKGVGTYMALSARYVKAFETKWMGGSLPVSEPLLGTADLQSLADLNNAISMVKSMPMDYRRSPSVDDDDPGRGRTAHAAAVVPVSAR